MIGHHGVSLNTLALQAFKDRYLLDTRTAENARLLEKVMLLCLDMYMLYFFLHRRLLEGLFYIATYVKTSRHSDTFILIFFYDLLFSFHFIIVLCIILNMFCPFNFFSDKPAKIS